METVKLSSKGQIVIPKSMREDLHLAPGAEFIISMTATGLSLMPTPVFPRVSVREVRGILAKKGRLLPSDREVKARISARLKAQDDTCK